MIPKQTYKHPKLGWIATKDYFDGVNNLYIVRWIRGGLTDYIYDYQKSYEYFTEKELIALGFEVVGEQDYSEQNKCWKEFFDKAPELKDSFNRGGQEKGSDDWRKVIEIVEQIGLLKISITTGLPRLKKLFMPKDEQQNKWLPIDINIDWDNKMIEVVGDDDHVYLREKALTDKTSSHIEFLPTVGTSREVDSEELESIFEDFQQGRITSREMQDKVREFINDMPTATTEGGNDSSVVDEKDSYGFSDNIGGKVISSKINPPKVESIDEPKDRIGQAYISYKYSKTLCLPQPTDEEWFREIITAHLPHTTLSTPLKPNTEKLKRLIREYAQLFHKYKRANTGVGAEMAENRMNDWRKKIESILSEYAAPVVDEKTIDYHIETINKLPVGQMSGQQIHDLGTLKKYLEQLKKPLSTEK